MNSIFLLSSPVRSGGVAGNGVANLQREASAVVVFAGKAEAYLGYSVPDHCCEGTDHRIRVAGGFPSSSCKVVVFYLIVPLVAWLGSVERAAVHPHGQIFSVLTVVLRVGERTCLQHPFGPGLTLGIQSRIESQGSSVLMLTSELVVSLKGLSSPLTECT